MQSVAVTVEHGNYTKTQSLGNRKTMGNALAYFHKSILFDSKKDYYQGIFLIRVKNIRQAYYLIILRKNVFFVCLFDGINVILQA